MIDSIHVIYYSISKDPLQSTIMNKLIKPTFGKPSA